MIFFVACLSFFPLLTHAQECVFSLDEGGPDERILCYSVDTSANGGDAWADENAAELYCLTQATSEPDYDPSAVVSQFTYCEQCPSSFADITPQNCDPSLSVLFPNLVVSLDPAAGGTPPTPSAPIIDTSKSCSCEGSIHPTGGTAICDGEAQKTFSFGESVSLGGTLSVLLEEAGCSLAATIVRTNFSNEAPVVIDDATCGSLNTEGEYSGHAYSLSCSVVSAGAGTAGGSGIFGGSLYKNPCSGDLIPGQEGCRDVNLLLVQVIGIAQFLISIIGTLAFFMFVYAGFRFILSMGNGEKAKEALGIGFQAVLGVIITLSAYIIVGFLLDALGVTSGFRIL